MKMVKICSLVVFLSSTGWAEEEKHVVLQSDSKSQKDGKSPKTVQSKKPVTQAKKQQSSGAEIIKLPTLAPLPDILFPTAEMSLPPLPPRPDFSRAKKRTKSSKRIVNGYRVITPINPQESPNRKLRWIAGKWVIGLK